MKVGAAQNGNIVKNGEYIHIYSKNGKKNILINPLYDSREFDDHYSYYFNGTEYSSLKEKLILEKIKEQKLSLNYYYFLILLKH